MIEAVSGSASSVTWDPSREIVSPDHSFRNSECRHKPWRGQTILAMVP